VGPPARVFQIGANGAGVKGVPMLARPHPNSSPSWEGVRGGVPSGKGDWRWVTRAVLLLDDDFLDGGDFRIVAKSAAKILRFLPCLVLVVGLDQ